MERRSRFSLMNWVTMKQRLKIASIAGSLRRASYSRMVLRTIADHAEHSCEFAHIDIGGLPHYDEDLDLGQASVTAARARQAIANSDAIVIVTPEFNHGLPGVLKNAIDWLSRPAFNSCLVGKPVFFLTLSPGALGGVRAQYQLRETLASTLCRLVPLPEIAITHVGGKVADGRLTEHVTLEFVLSQWQRFLTEVTSPADRSVESSEA